MLPPFSFVYNAFSVIPAQVGLTKKRGVEKTNPNGYNPQRDGIAVVELATRAPEAAGVRCGPYKP
jgi:hypothetical protein